MCVGWGGCRPTSWFSELLWWRDPFILWGGETVEKGPCSRPDDSGPFSTPAPTPAVPPGRRSARRVQGFPR